MQIRHTSARPRGRVGAGRPLLDRPYPPLQTVRAALTAYGFPFTLCSEIVLIWEVANMEQVVTLSTEYERFSVASCHDLLPSFLSTGDIFHSPNVMDLKWAFLCPAVFALLFVQAADQFRPTEC